MLVPGVEIGSGSARPRPRAGRRHRARPARPGPHRRPGVRPARRRRTRRGLQPRGDRVRRRHRAGALTAIVIDNAVGHARLAGRHRQPVHRQRLDRRHVDGRDHDALRRGPAPATTAGPPARRRRRVDARDGHEQRCDRPDACRRPAPAGPPPSAGDDDPRDPRASCCADISRRTTFDRPAPAPRQPATGSSTSASASS